MLSGGHPWPTWTASHEKVGWPRPLRCLPTSLSPLLSNAPHLHPPALRSPFVRPLDDRTQPATKHRLKIAETDEPLQSNFPLANGNHCVPLDILPIIPTYLPSRSDISRKFRALLSPTQAGPHRSLRRRSPSRSFIDATKRPCQHPLESKRMVGAVCCSAQPVDFDGEVILFHFKLLKVVSEGAFRKVCPVFSPDHRSFANTSLS